MDIVKTLQSVKSLADFIEGGPLADALSDIGLVAAKESLSKAKLAVNRPAQIWSAINHLEGAKASIEKTLKSRRGLILTTRTAHFVYLMHKLNYILCLMMSCYYYLDEKKLVQRISNEITSRINGGDFDGISKTGLALLLMTYTLNPINWIELNKVDKYKVDFKKFYEALYALPRGEFLPDH